jgi:hypothetical protein
MLADEHDELEDRDKGRATSLSVHRAGLGLGAT